MALAPLLPPLQGFTVGITAARRWEDQAQHLASRGAEILHAPALRSDPADPEGELRHVTEALVTRPPDLTILTTGAGASAWFSAADSFGAGSELLEALRRGAVIPRGPKTVAACIQAGLDVPRRGGHERVREVLEAARAGGGLEGRRVAVQLDGAATSWLVDELRREGAQVVSVRVYHWQPSHDDEPVRKLIDGVCRLRVHAVTFTSTPAVRNVFSVARQAGRDAELRERFASGTAAVSIGPVTSEALRREGVADPVEPARARLGAMVAALVHHLEGRRRILVLAGCEVLIQGAAVLVDGAPRALSEQDRHLLAVLAEANGRVVPKQALLDRGLGAGAVSEHAVEVAVARLRRRLGPAGAGVQTVFRRGYRLALDGAGSGSATSITPPVRRTS
ncbi:MAG TPA: uroporphyrinogen-III synthase [Egibacteraceae bacterium]|nr:uroporphyrinogen-III synthase [Egibacteraceae bacterium]